MRTNERLQLCGASLTLVPYCVTHVDKYHEWMKSVGHTRTRSSGTCHALSCWFSFLAVGLTPRSRCSHTSERAWCSGAVVPWYWRVVQWYMDCPCPNLPVLACYRKLYSLSVICLATTCPGRLNCKS